MAVRRAAAGAMLQCAVALAVLAMLAVMPPVAGPMLVVPVMRRSVWTWLPDGADIRLISAGPVAGSWIVSGRRDRLLPAALRHGAIVVAADPALCGLVAGR